MAQHLARPASFRADHTHNTNPIRLTGVALDTPPPSGVIDHFTGGFAYKVKSNSKIEFAAGLCDELTRLPRTE